MELSCINVRFSVPKPAPQPSHLHHRALWVEESSLAPEEVRHSPFALGSSICFCWTCTLGQKVQGAVPRLEYYVSILFSSLFFHPARESSSFHTRNRLFYDSVKLIFSSSSKLYLKSYIKVYLKRRFENYGKIVSLLYMVTLVIECLAPKAKMILLWTCLKKESSLTFSAEQ